MKREKSAFTLVELLTVLGIIAIVVALLIPALSKVRTMAKETQQRAQLNAIELGILAFKNDEENHYGDFPPSHGYSDDGSGNIDYLYCGAMTLAEALVGWDMMGFHPKSAWRHDGEGNNSADETYDPAKSRDGPPSDGVPDTLTERKGPYLDTATANVFKIGDLYANASSQGFDPINFVICDVFGKKSVLVGTKTVKAGAPILYYKANTNSKTLAAADELYRIYSRMDNLYLIRDLANNMVPLANPAATHPNFYDYISDPKVTTPTVQWPFNPESYLLISAGADGIYGTKDDICNFNPNLPN